MIKYVTGDLFSHVDKSDEKILIPHIVNNKGAWGAGFVLPLSKWYPKSKERYVDWFRWSQNRYRQHEDSDMYPKFQLGQTQIVLADTSVVVCNMLAQTLGGRRPLRYDALIMCMLKVAAFAKDGGYNIHCPKFGSGLARGSWEFINELITDCWEKRGIEVIVYSLEK